MARRLPAPPECAICGAAIPPSAHACPGCGADERTGWREQDRYDGLDLPDSAFADEDDPPPRDDAFARARRADAARQRRGELPWYWFATGVALLLALILGALSLALAR